MATDNSANATSESRCHVDLGCRISVHTHRIMGSKIAVQRSLVFVDGGWCSLNAHLGDGVVGDHARLGGVA